MDRRKLISRAIQAVENAYAPYSGFKVGAALLTKSGKIYTGCNIESVSFTPTICAERTAIFKAVSDGEREFEAIAIVGGPDGNLNEPGSGPCGVCRQVMVEFSKDLTIILAQSEDNYQEYRLDELLPLGFTPKELNNDL